MVQSRSRRITRSNRRGMAGIAVVVLVLMIVLEFQSRKLAAKNLAYQLQKEELQQQIKDEEIRAAEIDSLETYIDSDEYIEKLARDKLGLVYEDEIIFKAEE